METLGRRKEGSLPAGGLLRVQQGGLTSAMLTISVCWFTWIASLPAFPGSNSIFIPSLCSYSEADPGSQMDRARLFLGSGPEEDVHCAVPPFPPCVQSGGSLG